LRVSGHQADGVDRIDRGVRLVADREALEGSAMRASVRTRVLCASDHRAQLFQIVAPAAAAIRELVA